MNDVLHVDFIDFKNTASDQVRLSMRDKCESGESVYQGIHSHCQCDQKK